jgi:hypothetical protein
MSSSLRLRIESGSAGDSERAFGISPSVGDEPILHRRFAIQKRPDAAPTGSASSASILYRSTARKSSSSIAKSLLRSPNSSRVTLACCPPIVLHNSWEVSIAFGRT